MRTRGREGTEAHRARHGQSIRSLLGGGGAYPRRAVFRVKAMRRSISCRVLLTIMRSFAGRFAGQFNSRIRVLS